jgi:cyclopropane fatty-acyl-phospholipid synthase-like methyltransferase
MFLSSEAVAYVRGRQWQVALDVAGELRVPADAHVLDIGCGGAFANQMLATRYRKVDGIDKSNAAIKRQIRIVK